MWLHTDFDLSTLGIMELYSFNEILLADIFPHQHLLGARHCRANKDEGDMEQFHRPLPDS